MKIIIITQEDSFAVPQNIVNVIQLGFTEVVEIVCIDSSHSLVNQKELFVKGFGFFQSAKMGMKLIINKMLDKADGFLSYQLLSNPRSVKNVAKKFKIPYLSLSDPNQEDFVNHITLLQPDVIVSYSAPVVFRKKLLSIPALGCINLHCSALPHFAGVMPSFWTLYKDQRTTGVTVHYMDDKIDNGKILGQKIVNIDDNETIFSLILKTKKEGGLLMLDVLKQMKEGTLKPMENYSKQGSYYSWPTVGDFKNYRKQSGKLI
ncbi:methionyl-tRNA formyltransferase [Chryseobacterium lacus]|uniref:methionyl-tRNA formyltransferase n=1 Tax=Chryseobacterium lacus TaxID=2058346 RepID=UPI000F88BA79|nr:formyltransferase family protein [Chryseobacterium lacus]RST27504.1 hypothetical protein EIZ46_04100 [Chryseobacterium lacus]